MFSMLAVWTRRRESRGRAEAKADDLLDGAHDNARAQRKARIQRIAEQEKMATLTSDLPEPSKAAINKKKNQRITIRLVKVTNKIRHNIV